MVTISGWGSDLVLSVSFAVTSSSNKFSFEDWREDEFQSNMIEVIGIIP